MAQFHQPADPARYVERGDAGRILRQPGRRRHDEHDGSDHGGTADINPAVDMGFMYNRTLADPDGHVWEAMWMDPAAIPG